MAYSFKLVITILILAPIIFFNNALAHHAFAAEFDANKPLSLTGTVTKMEWINPHVWIHLDVKTDSGATENWAFEAGTPNVLFRRGFTRRSLLPDAATGK